MNFQPPDPVIEEKKPLSPSRDEKSVSVSSESDSGKPQGGSLNIEIANVNLKPKLAKVGHQPSYKLQKKEEV